MISRRSFVTGASALVAGALLTACGSSGAENAASGAAGSQAGSSSSVASGASASLTASSSSPAAPSGSSSSSSTSAASAASAGGAAVVYFSATGTTRAVAEKLAARLGVSAQEIEPAQPYTADDLDYNTEGTRATVEARDASARPALANVPNMSGAGTVYLGYPIWWGQAAAPARTFVETADLAGKTVVPFCTSGGSGIESASLQALAPAANWEAGMRMTASDADVDALLAS